MPVADRYPLLRANPTIHRTWPSAHPAVDQDVDNLVDRYLPQGAIEGIAFAPVPILTVAYRTATGHHLLLPEGTNA
jgi:hypothetical protein